MKSLQTTIIAFLALSFFALKGCDSGTNVEDSSEYWAGYDLAASLVADDYGITPLDEIISACQATTSAVSNETNEQRDAFWEGCEDGAIDNS